MMKLFGRTPNLKSREMQAARRTSRGAEPGEPAPAELFRPYPDGRRALPMQPVTTPTVVQAMCVSEPPNPLALLVTVCRSLDPWFESAHTPHLSRDGESDRGDDLTGNLR